MVEKTRKPVNGEDPPHVKISITVSPAFLDRFDRYRRHRGGLNRSAAFALAVSDFMDYGLPLKDEAKKE